MCYELSQSRFNLRPLYYIKTQLGVGSVTKDNTKGQFCIKDRKVIEEILLPVFEKYPLLTSKYFDYLRFKKALTVLNDLDLTKKEKDVKLLNLKNLELPYGYKSPVWKNVSLPLTKKKNLALVKTVISKAWLVGFFEAKGEFYFKNNDIYLHDPIKHGIFIIHLSDLEVLQAIGIILDIPNPVKDLKLCNHYVLNTTHSRAIQNIIVYFKGTMIGTKSLEYKLWARSHNRNKGDREKLSNLGVRLAKLQRIRGGVQY